jgi:nucleoside-diphosphate-sugar epimerase
MKSNSLIIGDSSQLNFYYPKEYDRMSSRNIDFDLINKNGYDTVYLLFAEQRTFLNETEKFFTNINVDYTIKLIDKIKNKCKRIIIFSTSELWNDYDGEVSINLPYKYNYTPYIKSKEILCDLINDNREKYDNVKIIYPFNFNSPYRKEGFLFSKIFQSIIYKKPIEVGDLNFVRDIIHPSLIVNHSIETNEDLLIGSGELINIENFVKNLYKINDLVYDEYVHSFSLNNLNNVRKNYYSKIKYSNYNDLLNLTHGDIRKNSISEKHY